MQQRSLWGHRACVVALLLGEERAGAESYLPGLVA